MAGTPMALVAELLEAIADAHTLRAVARGLAFELGARCSLTTLTLIAGDHRVVAHAAGNRWQCVDEPPLGVTGVELVPGLTLGLARGATLPAYFDDPSFRAAVGQVIGSSLRHLAVIQRVAELSRRAHVESRELRADVERLAERPAVVARSPAMRAVLARAELVARHPTTVLLTGESGTGKEVLAREIHRLSPRVRRPMLQINCGAIPESLVESELFGHERGAFTGADRVRAGVFERAHRGTLLLDEVGELPASAQTKLLRVLQERQLVRVGGTEQINVDVRVIAATNRSLRAMVRDGSFREDLYYRLDVFSISLPPLRDRKEDLGPLAAALVGEIAGRLRIEPPAIPGAVMTRLAAHDWPGNVRELANVLETGLILGGGSSLELAGDFGASAGATPTAFDAAVRQTIESTLRTTRGKIYGHDGAAARLGLKPGTLQSKMRKLGIARARFV